MQQYLPFTVLKLRSHNTSDARSLLQQYLPFTVLKLKLAAIQSFGCFLMLQQYLPFTVLKPVAFTKVLSKPVEVATVLTVYGIET